MRHEAKSIIFNSALIKMLDYMRDTNNAERHLSIARYDYEQEHGEFTEEDMDEWHSSIEGLWDATVDGLKMVVNMLEGFDD